MMGISSTMFDRARDYYLNLIFGPGNRAMEHWTNRQ